jgi:hypothetical protein
MLYLLLLASALSTSPAQTPTSAPVDVSTLKVGAPAAVAELDLGKLKGDLREVCWSPDGAQLYVQTMEGVAPAEKPHHYTVAAAGGALQSIDQQPDWAREFWITKSYQSAPGVPAMAITVEHGTATTKGLPPEGSVRGTGVGAQDLANSSSTDATQNVIRLVLLDEAVGEFVETRPIPGLTFSWGPESSGAIAFTDRTGRLILFDQKQHKRTVPAVKDALLPAWSSDGSRLAWVQKAGRKKYTLVWAPVTKG